MPEKFQPPKLSGLAQTLAVLAETKNEAALSVLVPGLDSREQAIQEGALRALLARRSPAGQRAISGTRKPPSNQSSLRPRA